MIKIVQNRFYRWLAWILPKRLVMWAFLRVAAYFTGDGKVIMPTLTTMNALRRWMTDNKL